MSEVCFSALVARHALSNRAAGHSASTLAWYAGHFRDYETWRIAAGLPDTLPGDETIERYIAHQRQRNLSPSTVLARFRALRAVLLFAEARNLISRAENPMHTVRPPKIPRQRPRHTSTQEMQRLLNSIHGERWLDHRDRLIIHLLFFSGLRLGEICGLKVADVDLRRREVFVRKGKGAKQRTVPIPPALQPVLLAYLYTRPSAHPHLLLSSCGQESVKGPLQPAGLRQVLRRRCESAGIDHLSAHKWRHGFAMWLRNQGTDLSDIAAAMGHSTTQVTQLYYAFTLAPAVHKAYSRALERLKSEEEFEE